MKWLSRLSFFKTELSNVRAQFYLLGQRMNNIEKTELHIMQELDNLKSAIAANKAATDQAIQRVEAKLAAAALVVPAELEAMSVDLAASTAKLDELAKDHGGSMGGVTE